MSNIRLERINGEIQKIVSKIINFEIEDPIVRDQIVSVVDVKTSADLFQSKIFVSILSDDENKKKIFETIRKSKGFIKRRLAEEMSLRVLPELVFEMDKTLERSSKVFDILKALEKQKKDTPDE